MSDYGITPNGVNVKKSELIQSEIHAELSAGWNVNTRNNPQSFLNVLVTDFADKLAELWMFGSGIYYSMYPSSAEGMNLDNAVQYAGITRKMSEKSYYPIHCKGIDGTVLPNGTRIASISNPVNYFSIVSSAPITREKFNEAAVKIQSVASSTVYTVAINGVSYSITSGEDAEELDILNALQAAITDILNFDVSVDEEKALLIIKALDIESTNSLALSSHLTTEYVVSIIQFASEQSGDIDQPDGTITQIVTSVSGLTEVFNAGGYLPGRDIETDTELRQSYLKKIFHMSSRMTDSISSILLNDVPGVDSVTVFENDTDYTTLTYTCGGSESGTYYFVSEALYYKFTMPTVSDGDKLVFNTGDKLLMLGEDVVSCDISTVAPVPELEMVEETDTLTYTCTGAESGKYCFHDGDDYYEFTMPSVSEGDELVFHTDTKKLMLDSTEISTSTTPSVKELVMESGLWPHSVECVVDGGDDSAIAKKILEAKAAGINTYGTSEVMTPDSLGNLVPIRFSRPDDIFIWFDCEITASLTEAMPANYVELIQAIIQEKMSEVDAGGFISPQKWLNDIFSTVSGIAYMEITMAAEESDTVSPMVYTCTGLESGACYLRYCDSYYVFNLNVAGGTAVVSGDTLTFNPADNGITMKLNGTTDVNIIVSSVHPAGTDLRAEFMTGYTLRNYQSTTRQRPRIKDHAMIGVTIVG